MKSKSYFILTLLLLLSVQLNAGWQRPVTNYTRHTYKAGNQNWMLQQHDNGWMYVANSNGLLEFDGASWNLYPIRNAKARAMRIGNDGRFISVESVVRLFHSKQAGRIGLYMPFG